MPTSSLLTAISLAAAIGGGAFIVARSKIFMPLRLWINGNRQQATAFAKETGTMKFRAWAWQKLAELVSCPFCLSVWMAGAACLLYNMRLVHGMGPLDWLTTTLAVSAASMLPVHVINMAITQPPGKP